MVNKNFIPVELKPPCQYHFLTCLAVCRSFLQLILQEIKLSSSVHGFHGSHSAIVLTTKILLFFQVLLGNMDKETVIGHILDPPVIARFIRLHPKEWRGHIAMRFDLYGCKHGKSFQQ